MGSADTGAALEAPYLSDKSVQIQGTQGVGGAMLIEGSNDGTNYVTLTDPQGNALTMTTVGVIEQILENTRFIRPRATAGDGTTAYDIYIVGVALVA
jgi:hypothetical protein